MGPWETVGALADIGFRQRGMFTQLQATDRGITWPVLKELEAARVIEMVFPGAYLLRGQPRDPRRDRLYAWWLLWEPAVLAHERKASQGPVISHTSAAFWHGVWSRTDDWFECVVPAGVTPPATTHVPGINTDIHQTQSLEQGWRWEDDLPVTGPIRTFVDLVQVGTSESDLARMSYKLESRRLCSVEDLAEALEPLAAAEGHRNGADYLDYLRSFSFPRLRKEYRERKRQELG